MGIGSRLLLLLAIPLTALLVVTGYGVYRGATQARDAAALTERTDVALSSYTLVEDLQAERASLVAEDRTSPELRGLGPDLRGRARRPARRSSGARSQAATDAALARVAAAAERRGARARRRRRAACLHRGRRAAARRGDRRDRSRRGDRRRPCGHDRLPGPGTGCRLRGTRPGHGAGRRRDPGCPVVPGGHEPGVRTELVRRAGRGLGAADARHPDPTGRLRQLRRRHAAPGGVRRKRRPRRHLDRRPGRTHRRPGRPAAHRRGRCRGGGRPAGTHQPAAVGHRGAGRDRDRADQHPAAATGGPIDRPSAAGAGGPGRGRGTHPSARGGGHPAARRRRGGPPPRAPRIRSGRGARGGPGVQRGAGHRAPAGERAGRPAPQPG